MSKTRRKRDPMPGDNVLGRMATPVTRECVTCHFKPIPIDDSCPNCGRDPIGRDETKWTDSRPPRWRQFEEKDLSDTDF